VEKQHEKNSKPPQTLDFYVFFRGHRNPKIQLPYHFRLTVLPAHAPGLCRAKTRVQPNTQGLEIGFPAEIVVRLVVATRNDVQRAIFGT
jgi:hypothetical protein